MANFSNVLLTPKADQFTKVVTLPAVQFDTTSTTFVDVTGITLSILDSFSTCVAIGLKTSASVTARARLLIETANIASPNIDVTLTTFQRRTSTVLQNTSGSTDTAKLQLLVTPSGTASIQALTTVLVVSPFTNIADRKFKANVTSIKFYTFGSAEGIEGKSSNSSATDTVEVIVNAVMDSFVWSANSGLALWDWNGDSIELA